MVPDAGGLPMKGPPEKSCGCLADVICHATIGESDLRVGDQLKPDVCNIQVKYGQVLSAVTVRDDTREVLKTNRMFDGKRVDVPVCFLKVRVRISEEQDEPVPAGYVLVKGVSTYDRSIDTGGRDPFSKPSKEWVSVPSKDASGESMPAAHKGFSIQLFEIHIERCFRSEEEKASYCGKVFLEEEKCRNYIISCPSLAAVLDRYQVENGSVEGTVVCDQRPDARLIQQLNEGIDKLIAERVEPDYHPNTGKVVLDIVHPSLYPYVRSVTKVTGPESSYEVSRTPPKQAGEGPPTTPSAGTVSRSQEPSGGETKEPPVSKDRWGRLYEDSNFQWLPSVFDISTTGECSIKSYINNLPTEGNAGLVAALEKLFESFLPLFETCYSYIRAIRFNDHDEESTWSGGLVGIPWNYAPDIAGSSLRGRELKVVTKIVEYQLGHEDSFEGVWHVEGMSHESIVMTGLYILDRDEGFDGGDILFKRAFLEHEASELYEDLPECRHSFTNALLQEGLLPLGTLETPKGRMVVFPNSHVHKLSKMSVNKELACGKGKQKRRIIVFWLVDPERKKMITTRGVDPPQQMSMSMEDAKRYRLELMEERKKHKQDWNVRKIELCEH